MTGETPAVVSCREEHRQVTKELRLLPHAGRFMWRRLKAIGCEAEAGDERLDMTGRILGKGRGNGTSMAY